MRATIRLLSCLCLLHAVFCLEVRAQAPIQKWIDNAMKAGSGVVTIPPGVHELPDGLRLGGAKKLALRGMERGECVLRLTGADNQALITIGAMAEGVEIANLILECSPAPGRPGPPPAAILCGPGGKPAPDGGSTGPRDVTIRDCAFQDWPGDAVHFTDARDAGVERCSFRDIGGTAVKMDAASKAVVVSGCWIIRAAAAIQAQDCAICEFTGNEIAECGAGILLSGTTTLKNADKPTGHKIMNNRIGQVREAAVQVAQTCAPAQLADNEFQGTLLVAGEGHLLKNNAGPQPAGKKSAP